MADSENIGNVENNENNPEKENPGGTETPAQDGNMENSNMENIEGILQGDSGENAMDVEGGSGEMGENAEGGEIHGDGETHGDGDAVEGKEEVDGGDGDEPEGDGSGEESVEDAMEHEDAAAGSGVEDHKEGVDAEKKEPELGEDDKPRKKKKAKTKKKVSPSPEEKLEVAQVEKQEDKECYFWVLEKMVFHLFINSVTDSRITEDISEKIKTFIESSEKRSLFVKYNSQTQEAKASFLLDEICSSKFSFIIYI